MLDISCLEPAGFKMSSLNTRPPVTNDPDSLSGWAEEEGNIQLALANDEHFRRLVILRMTELSGRVRNLESAGRMQGAQIAIVEDKTQDASGNVKAILAVGAAFFAIATMFGGLFAWLWTTFGGKQP